MSNDVATKNENTAVAALAGLKRGVQNVRQAIPTSSTDPILRMGTDGIWVYGQENIEVEEESEWAINPVSIQHGYVCWTNKEKGEGKNELLGEVYAPMSAAPIDPTTLPDKGWPWKPATTVRLKCVSGDDEGTEVIYKPSSVGGANVMQTLLDAIEKQLDAGTDEIVPVVELVNDNYQHKQYGKTYVPQFDIKSWVTMDGPVEGEGDAPEPEAEKPAPKADKKKKADKKPEPEAEASDADTGDDAAPAEEPKTEGRTRRRRRSS